MDLVISEIGDSLKQALVGRQTIAQRLAICFPKKSLTGIQPFHSLTYSLWLLLHYSCRAE